MNEINAAQRLQVAATAKGEAEKIMKVKQAEAAKQSDILYGEGVAGQRKAIIDGLRESVAEFKESLRDADSSEVMRVVLLTQYFDTLKNLAGHGDRVILVNEGIGGNQIIGPAAYDPNNPVSGGPSVLQRLARDVLSLSGVTAVIWHEGTNDVSAGATADAIEAGISTVVQQLRTAIPGIRIVGTTITSEVGAAGNGGTPAAAAERIALNQFIKSSGLFDAIADFYNVTTDPATGAMKAQYIPNTSIGGAGDHVHPNRAGYLAMGNAVDIRTLVAPRD